MAPVLMIFCKLLMHELVLGGIIYESRNSKKNGNECGLEWLWLAKCCIFLFQSRSMTATDPCASLTIRAAKGSNVCADCDAPSKYFSLTLHRKIVLRVLSAACRSNVHIVAIV